jgi:hypothetical protein
MSKDLKAIRIGEKIIVFVDGKRQVINKSNSPETFDIIVEYIKNNETEKIKSLFSSFDESILGYLKNIFIIKDKVLYFKGKEKKEIRFSKIVLRKAIEFYSLGVSSVSLLKFAKKIERNSGSFSFTGNNFFSKIEKFSITKNGNLVLNVNFENETIIKRLVGSPLSVDQRGISFNLSTKNENNSEMKQVLISPYDIYGFNTDSLVVTRYKILNEEEIKGDNLITVKNEDLFEISYNILEEFNKKETSKV